MRRVEATGGWRWTFPELNVHSPSFETQELANAELQVVHRELYPEWADVTSRASHLRWVKALMAERRHYLGFEDSSAVSTLVEILQFVSPQQFL